MGRHVPTPPSGLARRDPSAKAEAARPCGPRSAAVWNGRSEFSAVHGIAAEELFDAEQLIVFGDAVGAAEGPGFDLAGIGGHGDVRDGGVLGFAGSMADDGRVL